jgi:hypothetical protein
LGDRLRTDRPPLVVRKGQVMSWDLKEPECLTQARLMVAAPEFVYEQLKFYSENIHRW